MEKPATPPSAPKKYPQRRPHNTANQHRQQAMGDIPELKDAFALIRQMVIDGFSLRLMVQALNDAQIPTAQVALGQGGRGATAQWHLRTVQKALAAMDLKTVNAPTSEILGRRRRRRRAA